MTEALVWAVILGLITGVGALLVLSGFSRHESRVRLPRPGRMTLIVVAAAIVVGGIVGWVTRSPVAIAITLLAAWSMPRIVGPDLENQRKVAMVEAIASWTEMLRDTLAAASGLNQAIAATAPIGPELIRPQLSALAFRLEVGERLPHALRLFADDLSDPTADLVCAALIQAERRQAGHLADLLGSLASAARQQAMTRTRIAVGRAKIRSQVRVVLGTVLVFATGMVLLVPDWLAPYRQLQGQLVLVGIAGWVAASLWWLIRLSRLPEPDRILARVDGGAS